MGGGVEWDIGVLDRMLGPGWGLGPRVRTGTASSNASQGWGLGRAVGILGAREVRA